jgi:hypothetical protein
MEDCDEEGCGSGSVCGHWERLMFPDQGELNAAGASDYMQAQDVMMYQLRFLWAQVISGLSLGTLKDVGYDGIVQDTSDPSCPPYEVRTVDLSTLNYPVLDDAGNRGDKKMMILDEDLDFDGMIDLFPTFEVEH